MSVLLPTDGPVRQTISGTDIDGIREVDGVIAAYEYKAIGAASPSKGQLRAMRSIGDFFIGSRWIYELAQNPPRTQEERNALEHGYKQIAAPVSAVIWSSKQAHKWLYRYLVDCGFMVTQTASNGYAIQFDLPDEKIKTHIFKPTEQWRAIAYIPDYYALYRAGKYCFHETNFIDPSFF